MDDFTQALDCPGCRRELGRRGADGTLKIDQTVIVNADMACCHCGYIIHWRRSDTRLQALVSNLRTIDTRRRFVLYCQATVDNNRAYPVM